MPSLPGRQIFSQYATIILDITTSQMTPSEYHHATDISPRHMNAAYCLTAEGIMLIISQVYA